MVSVTEITHRLDGEAPTAVAAELRRLRVENARLLRLLKLTRQEKQSCPARLRRRTSRHRPGRCTRTRPPQEKVGFFGALFAARTDVYAVRYENRRTGRTGWVPAVRGGFRKDVPHAGGTTCR